MGETGWNEHGMSIIGGEFMGRPFAERRRIRPKVDGDVENPAHRASDEFRFGLWLDLQMKTSQGASTPIVRDVALNPLRRKSLGAKFIFAPGASEEAAIIRPAFGHDEHESIERRFLELHDNRPRFGFRRRPIPEWE